MSLLCRLSLHSWKCYKKAVFLARGKFRITDRRECQRCGRLIERSLTGKHWITIRPDGTWKS